MRITIFEFKVVLFNIHRLFSNKAFHVQMNNMIALGYLIKIGGSSNQQIAKFSEQIQFFLLSKEIKITAEDFPQVLNMRQERKSCHFGDKREWLLCRNVLKQVISALGLTDMDFFASRVLHQVPAYMIQKPDPQSKTKDAFQQKQSYLYPFTFPLFCFISKALNKERLEKVTMILINPLRQAPRWCIEVPEMCVENLLLSPTTPKFLVDPQGNPDQLVVKNSL